MITLDSTLRSLEVVLAGAVTTSELPVVVSYADIDDAAGTAANQGTSTQTSGASAQTALAAPASGVSRIVEYVSVYNADTVNATVTVSFNDGGTVRQMCQVVLTPGQSLQYVRDGGWIGP